MSKKPLEGIKVVELSLMVAAPACARIMADLGADVIKVENTTSPDTFRPWGAAMKAPIEDDCNPLFDNLNAGKKAIAINLKDPKGLEVMYKLLGEADVFITNTRVQGLKRLGLDYDSIKDKFPKLVMTHMLGYGEKGPEKDRPGYDNSAFFSKSGILFSQAIYETEDKSYPMPATIGFGDLTCSITLAAGTLAALYKAKCTGEGDYVPISLYGTAVYITSLAMESEQFGYLDYPNSRYDGSFYGVPYKCADGRWMLITIVNFGRDHDTLYKAVGCDDLIGKEGYTAVSDFFDKEKSKAMMQRFEQIFLTKTSEEWMKIFIEYDLTAEVLAKYRDNATDPQAIANGFVFDHMYPNGVKTTLARTPLYLRSMGLPDFVPAPTHGGNTEDIMKQLGYDQAAIDEMIAGGAVMQHQTKK